MQWITDNYSLIKFIHVLSVVVSGSLFVLRGIWVIQESGNLAKRWVRITPHIVDTLLLLSAILLAIGLQQYPVSDNWLTAKVIALLVYIGLGMMAIRHGRTRQQKIISWIAAIVVFAYIVGAAISRSATLGLIS